MASLRILADENIALVRAAFGALGTVQLCPGRSLTPATVRDADVLLVRSVTRVDRALLAGSRVRFVGSATIGRDHVDEGFLQDQGIAFASAPGSNAESVVDYVLAALLRLAVQTGEVLRGKTVGVVGCGNIGGRLAGRLPAFGVRVLKNDPPLVETAEQAGQPHDFVPLATLLAEADVLSLHVPLVGDGRHATVHLLDEAALRRMKPGAWLLNTARGPIVSNAALRRVLKEGHLGAAVLDVWEGEPTPDLALLRRVDFATPHIAGYAYDGKVQGTVQLYHALMAHLGLPPAWDTEVAYAPAPEDRLRLDVPEPTLPETAWLAAAAQQMYDLAADDARLRPLADLPLAEQGAYFTRLRKHYPRRRVFSRHLLPEGPLPAAYRVALEQGLKVQIAG